MQSVLEASETIKQGLLSRISDLESQLQQAQEGLVANKRYHDDSMASIEALREGLVAMLNEQTSQFLSGRRDSTTDITGLKEATSEVQGQLRANQELGKAIKAKKTGTFLRSELVASQETVIVNEANFERATSELKSQIVTLEGKVSASESILAATIQQNNAGLQACRGDRADIDGLRREVGRLRLENSGLKVSRQTLEERQLTYNTQIISTETQRDLAFRKVDELRAKIQELEPASQSSEQQHIYHQDEQQHECNRKLQGLQTRCQTTESELTEVKQSAQQLKEDIRATRRFNE